MLPGLRFLFAATLMSASLLVFGMGAIALLRASHQQFTTLAPGQPPEPVFAQAPATMPSLSLLRADPAPAAPPLGEIVPPQREAALSGADRPDDVAQPAAEAQPAAPDAQPVESRTEAAPAVQTAAQPAATDLPKEALQAAPLAEKPADVETTLAQAPTQDDIPTASVTKSEVPPLAPAASPQTSEAPDTATPERTGSIAAPAPTEAQLPVEAPLPVARPHIAALTPAAAVESAKPTPKPAVKKPAKRKAHQSRARHTEPKREKLPATTSAPPLNLGYLFGGGE